MLNSIFYLAQSETDFINMLKPIEKVSLCVAAFEQASRLLARNRNNKKKVNSKEHLTEIQNRKNIDWFAIGKDPDQNIYREIRQQWFENTLIISKQLPAYKLNLSLTGNFFELIEKYL